MLVADLRGARKHDIDHLLDRGWRVGIRERGSDRWHAWVNPIGERVPSESRQPVQTLGAILILDDPMVGCRARLRRTRQQLRKAAAIKFK